MSISPIGTAKAGYQAAVAAVAKTSPAPTPASSPSTIVTLSDGSESNVTEYSGKLSGTPLAVAWAPQMLVQADANKDEQLDSAEFAQQLERAGVTVDEAKKMFASFDKSADGALSVDEYVQGVKDSIAHGSQLFAGLSDLYTHDAAGHFDPAGFLKDGQALAEKYARESGQSRG
jgi:hypothetical protein